MAVDFTRPHRRFNPLSGRWVQVSPHRLDRPWQGEQSEPEPRAPAYDADCYLCPGNTRKGGAVNPDYEAIFVFDNDFAALTPEGAGEWSDGLFRAANTRGQCRVICYSPDHAKTLPMLALDQIRGVIDTWAAQTQDLSGEFANVQVFENKGAMMGCSNPHPHGQIWATEHIPNEVLDADRSQKAYLEEHDSVLLMELAEREISAGDRVIDVNDHWLAVVPFWAAWPFEALLMPRFTVSRLPGVHDAARDSLAAILKAITTRFDNLFQTSFPYSMGWHQAPYRRDHDGLMDASHFQLHAHFYPPLLRSASVRKFMVGYEMLAEPQRDLTPERAAHMLRNADARQHYLSQAGGSA